MRALLWLLLLFALSSALALFAGDNRAMLTLWWPPQRAYDVSLNLALAALFALFIALHALLRAISALRAMPQQTQLWRQRQRLHALHAHLLDAASHYLAGRYTRARKSASHALQIQQRLDDNAPAKPQSAQLRALAHYLLAESSHSLRDESARDEHLQHALAASQEETQAHTAALTSEGIVLRAARWDLHDGAPQRALQRLGTLTQGAARRIVALRLKLKATRQLGRSDQALETARALVRHKAFPAAAGQAVLAALAAEQIAVAPDVPQLLALWHKLTAQERALPHIALCAAQRLLDLQGDPVQAASWLHGVWSGFAADPQAALGQERQRALVGLIERLLGEERTATPWLARIEQAHQRHPRNAVLQYLMGMACVKRQLWGKAQTLLTQAAQQLHDEPAMRRNAWCALAHMAQERSDAAAALQAWKTAALC